MNLNSIHHLAIIVSDYQKSKNFYVDKLGFKILRENYRKDRGEYKLDLKIGECELEIFRDKKTRRDFLNRKRLVLDIWLLEYQISKKLLKS